MSDTGNTNEVSGANDMISIPKKQVAETISNVLDMKNKLMTDPMRTTGLLANLASGPGFELLLTFVNATQGVIIDFYKNMLESGLKRLKLNTTETENITGKDAVDIAIQKAMFITNQPEFQEKWGAMINSLRTLIDIFFKELRREFSSSSRSIQGDLVEMIQTIFSTIIDHGFSRAMCIIQNYSPIGTYLAAVVLLTTLGMAGAQLSVIFYNISNVIANSADRITGSVAGPLTQTISDVDKFKTYMMNVDVGDVSKIPSLAHLKNEDIKGVADLGADMKNKMLGKFASAKDKINSAKSNVVEAKNEAVAKAEEAKNEVSAKVEEARDIASNVGASAASSAANAVDYLSPIATPNESVSDVSANEPTVATNEAVPDLSGVDIGPVDYVSSAAEPGTQKGGRVKNKNKKKKSGKKHNKRRTKKNTKKSRRQNKSNRRRKTRRAGRK